VDVKRSSMLTFSLRPRWRASTACSAFIVNVRRHDRIVVVRRQLATANVRRQGSVHINSIRDLAVATRGRRLDLGLSQAELAARASVSRQWISEFEAGKPTAELGLALRLIHALGLGLDVRREEDRELPPSASVNLDALLDEYRDA
jgi:HTH-type transcriptional regulator / antitoxin HipB